MLIICQKIYLYFPIFQRKSREADEREKQPVGRVLQRVVFANVEAESSPHGRLVQAWRIVPQVCAAVFCAVSLQAQPVDSVKQKLPDSMAVKSSHAPSLPKHTFRSELSWAALPWIISGVILRKDKANFREVRNKFVYNFHHVADDYSQYAPLLVATGLKLAGYEGRSRWDRYGVSTAASYAVMAALVNAMKYSMKELRPDGSTCNSFPSGHTATAFAAATILHKEYGMTRSPWLSVAGYALATATGCMRVLNNRHWISDTFAGAGIGILSTELGYAIGDLLFKNKGLLRPDIEGCNSLYRHPSFFSVHLGIGLGEQTLDLMASHSELAAYYDQLSVKKLRLSRATVVGAEGAFFFNPYFGVGGRMRASTRLVKNWGDFARSPITEPSHRNPMLGGFIDEYMLDVESNHLCEFSVSAGAYFNLPLTPRLALGAKLLAGRNYVQGIDISARVSGEKHDVDLSFVEEDGKRYLLYHITAGKEGQAGERYEAYREYLSVTAGRTTEVGTGVSLTYAYKSRMAFRFFVDYDFTRKRYHISYAPMLFVKDAARTLTFNGRPVDADEYIVPSVKHLTKNMSKFVMGGAFSVSF